MQRNPELTQQLTATIDKIKVANHQKEIHSIVELFLVELTKSDKMTLLHFDKSEMKLYNNNGHQSQNICVVGSAGLLGICLLEKKSAIYNHPASEKHYAPLIDNPYDMALKGQIIYPIMSEQGSVIAILRLSRSIQFHLNYTQYDLDLLNSLDEFFINVIEILQSKVREDDETTMTLEQKPENPTINEDMLFLSNTVHDIRTPANSLYGFLELMEEHAKDERLLEYIGHAKESAKFINTLTDSILYRVKHDKESSESKPKVVNSIQFFSSIANVFTANMSKKEINYLIYIDPSIPKEIEVEELKMKRILINLIGNAYKFTPSNRVIEFTVAYDKSEQLLQLAVNDTGIGIAQENKEKIFQSFAQAESDTALNFGGTGLGLAISAQYVKELGGKLQLQSKLGKGSNFYFTTPIKVVDERPSHSIQKDNSRDITMLTNHTNSMESKNIKRYLHSLSIAEENIKVSTKLEENSTHTICFEHLLTEEIITQCKKRAIELLVIEEKLFSISEDARYSDIKVIAQNSYYGESIYAMFTSKRKPKVLIADDNHINVVLLKTILEGEDCEIDTSLDGQEVLDKLIDGLEQKKPYDIIFTDNHMPILSGSEVIEKYRAIESRYNSPKPIIAISITGNPSMEDEEKKLYDTIVAKPFEKSTIEEAFYQAIKRA